MSPSSTDWQQIHEKYQSGDFKQALYLLQSQAEPNSAYYYYNLGTVHFHLHHLGESIAYLEKANYLRPHDPDIQHNLKQARSALVETIGEDRIDPASTWYEQLTDRVAPDEIRATLALLGLITLLIWTRNYLHSKALRKSILNPASYFALFALGITLLIYVTHQHSRSFPPAVVLTSQTIRSGPGDQYLELGRAEAGSKLRILGPISPDPGDSLTGSKEQSSSQSAPDSWRQVRYSGNEVGWIRTSGILPLQAK